MNGYVAQRRRRFYAVIYQGRRRSRNGREVAGGTSWEQPEEGRLIRRNVP
jgi:hypothetical protein